MGENEIKGNEMARELHQIGRAEGRLKVPEKMPLDGFTKGGEFFFLKAATIQRGPWTATAEEVEQQKIPQKQGRKCS